MSSGEWVVAIVGMVWTLLTTGIMYYKARAAVRGLKQQMSLLPDDPPEWKYEARMKVRVLRRLFYKEIPLLVAGVFTIFPPYVSTEDLVLERVLITVLIFTSQCISFYAAGTLDEYMSDKTQDEE